LNEDIAFQLMSRMKEEGVSPNVHIYNSAISACARCNLWEKGLELFEEMDTVGVERDVVSFNAVLDAVSPQVQLGRRLFELGIEKGFYARVSRLGEQWLELDLHFLSLGGGEIALGWWFEECLVPYLVNTSKLAAVKSIDIVTGYGKTRMRGVRHGDDGMRKRVRAMLHYMNIQEIEQSNKGRIHIDKEALIAEVQKNGGRIIFDEEGYNRYKEENTTANHVPDVPQKLRPRLDLTEPYPLPDPLVDRRSSGPRDGYDRRVSNASRRGSSDIDYGRRSSNNYRNQDERYSSGHRGSGYGNRGGDYNRQGSYDDAFKNHSNYEVDSRALSTVFSNSRGSFNRRSNPQVNDQYQVQVHYDSASNGRVQELYENPREDYYSESRSSNPQYENQYLNRRASDTTDYRGRQGRSNQYEEDRGQYRRRGTYGGRETTTQPYGSHPDQRVDAHVASYQHPQYERQSYGDQDQGEGRYRPLKSSNQEIDSYNGDVGSYGRDSDRGEKRPATSVGGEQPPPAKRRGYDIDSTRSSITGARGF
jgi:pentatricopeptide repeat protein